MKYRICYVTPKGDREWFTWEGTTRDLRVLKRNCKSQGYQVVKVTPKRLV